MKALQFLLILFVIFSLPATAQEAEDIDVNLINQIPDPVEPGDSVELSFRLDNNGDFIKDQFTVELLPQYPFSIFESKIKDLSSLDARQTGNEAVVVKYKVLVDKNADEGSHGIHLRYKIGNGNWVRAGPFDVTVKPVEAIITVLSAESNRALKAGTQESFNVELKNLGKSLLKNIRVKLDLNDIPVTPISESNEKVISSLSSNQAVKLSFEVVADSTANSGIYKAPLLLEFIDDSGREYLKEAVVGLLVYDRPEFSLALRETEVYTPDSAGEVVLSISNTGPSEIKFMTMELLETADYSVISAPLVYLGNLEADDFETAEFDIRTNKGTLEDVNLEVRLTYKDSLNKEIVSDEIVQLPLYSSSQAKKLGLVDDDRNFVFLYFTIGLQIIALVFGVFMLVDCWRNTLAKYKKILWTIIILTGIGAVLYYFIARRRR